MKRTLTCLALFLFTASLAQAQAPDKRVYVNGWWLCTDTMTFRLDCSAGAMPAAVITNFSMAVK